MMTMVRIFYRDQHMANPRILFLSQCLPFPPHSGVTNRTLNILRQLQRGFDVELVAFSRRNHQPDCGARRAARTELLKTVSIVADPIPIQAETSKVALLWNHLRSITTGRPYLYYEYESEKFGQQLRSLIRGTRPDLVHFDSLDLYRWLEPLPEIPRLCTHHSIESDLLRIRARRIANPLVRNYMKYQAAKIERLERDLAPTFACNIMMSDIDALRLKAIAPSSSTAVIPNGVDTSAFKPSSLRNDLQTAGRVAFLGPTYMFPNRDAVEFLLEEIWPHIRSDYRTASLDLIGRCPDDFLPYVRSEPGVIVSGYVPDIRPHFAEASCCVVPIRVGGGTRLKILDSWALGRAVISTSVGCEGLQAIDGENILIRDDPLEFAAAVIEVLSNPALRQGLEIQGRATAEQCYSWEAIGAKLRGIYSALLD